MRELGNMEGRKYYFSHYILWRERKERKQKSYLLIGMEMKGK